MISRKVIKVCLILIGLLFVGLGVLGIFIPGLPTTIFLIAAAGCFAKSSPCLHAWLMSHPWFGSMLTHWQQSRSIPKKAKIIALISMLIAASYSFVVLDDPLNWIILLIMLFPAIYVSRLPLTQDRSSSINS